MNFPSTLKIDGVNMKCRKDPTSGNQYKYYTVDKKTGVAKEYSSLFSSKPSRVDAYCDFDSNLSSPAPSIGPFGSSSSSGPSGPQGPSGPKLSYDTPPDDVKFREATALKMPIKDQAEQLEWAVEQIINIPGNAAFFNLNIKDPRWFNLRNINNLIQTTIKEKKNDASLKAKLSILDTIFYNIIDLAKAFKLNAGSDDIWEQLARKYDWNDPSQTKYREVKVLIDQNDQRVYEEEWVAFRKESNYYYGRLIREANNPQSIIDWGNVGDKAVKKDVPPFMIDVGQQPANW